MQRLKTSNLLLLYKRLLLYDRLGIPGTWKGQNSTFKNVLYGDSMKQQYAIQCRFGYGWDYTGSCDGERVLYDSFHEANEDLKADMPDLVKLGHTSGDWRVSVYDPDNDTKDDLR